MKTLRCDSISKLSSAFLCYIRYYYNHNPNKNILNKENISIEKFEMPIVANGSIDELCLMTPNNIRKPEQAEGATHTEAVKCKQLCNEPTESICIDATSNVALGPSHIDVQKTEELGNQEITISPVGNRKLKIEIMCLKNDGEKETYHDYRTEIVDALHGIGENRRTYSTTTAPTLVKIPPCSRQVFYISKWNHGDLHNIVDVLLGQPLAYNVLDSFLSLHVKKQMNMTKLKSDESVPPFKYLSVRYYMIRENEKVVHKTFHQTKFNPKPFLKNSIIIAPICNCNHYFVSIFDFPNKVVNIFDPAWDYMTNDIRCHHIRNLLKILVSRMQLSNSNIHNFSQIDIDERAALLDEWKFQFHTKCTQQEDAKSCGYYVIKFVKHILMGEPEKCYEKVNKAEILQIRFAIVKKLLQSTEHGKVFLDAITY